MIRTHVQHGLLVAAMLSSPLDARVIEWTSDANLNLSSDDSVMDGGFRFELGVFDGTFVPTPSNREQWAANWRPADRVDYNPLTQSYDGFIEVGNNDAPFTAGKETYVWGWRVDAAGAEWILFRDTSWNWPESDPFNPFALEWTAADATAIIGEIGGPGDSFLMQSAAVTTTWPQWQAEFPDGEILDAPDDDPDHDGTPNLLEFVFGTDPLVAGPPPQTPLSVVTVDDARFVQISIPRRIDHAANLIVEVSGDLETWHSGPAHTQVVTDDLGALVVRDLTPLSPSAPARFMRLKATLP